VRNLGSTVTYTLSIDPPDGISVTPSAAALTLAAGASATYEVSFRTESGAALDQYAFGSLTWSDGAHNVRSPLVIRPIALAAPATFASSGATTGSGNLNVQFGYNGPFEVAVQGLVAGQTETRTVADDKTNNFNVDAPDTNQGIQMHTFAVSAGTVHIRFRLFDEFTDGNDDLDLYLYDPDGKLVGVSRGPTSAETIDVPVPQEGTYKLYVHGRETQGSSADYTLFSWQLSSSNEGNLTATPSPSTATLGGSGTVTVSWSDLMAGTKYLGRLGYTDGVAEIASTLVTIEP
jgi:hypothetical protein